MIKMVCINDNNRPVQIPESDWIKEGSWYYITHVSIQVNQIENGSVVLGCDVYEKPLSIEKHYPFECFRLSRFGIEEKDVEKLMQLIKDCIELPPSIDVDKLIHDKEIQLV